MHHSLIITEKDELRRALNVVENTHCTCKSKGIRCIRRSGPQRIHHLPAGQRETRNQCYWMQTSLTNCEQLPREPNDSLQRVMRGKVCASQLQFVIYGKKITFGDVMLMPPWFFCACRGWQGVLMGVPRDFQLCEKLQVWSHGTFFCCCCLCSPA